MLYNGQKSIDVVKDVKASRAQNTSDANPLYLQWVSACRVCLVNCSLRVR
jgi:hypothetical protein